eukprot:GHVU01234548.1.p1 GENE.GHVU01234548.1~~GHVU01234548.1.p1  ORF type:complete len:103 (-),score=10.96 GHVU01234548.1:212-520(-)
MCVRACVGACVCAPVWVHVCERLCAAVCRYCSSTAPRGDRVRGGGRGQGEGGGRLTTLLLLKVVDEVQSGAARLPQFESSPSGAGSSRGYRKDSRCGGCGYR